MNFISDKVKKTLPYLVGLIILLYMYKPSLLFKPNGQLREYGFGFDKDGYKKTLYTMQNIIFVITIGVYVYANKN